MVMEIKVFQDVEAYLSLAEAYLRREEAANNLILGIALKLKKTLNVYGDEKPFMAIVYQGEEIQAVALMTPPYNVIIYSQVRQNPEAYDLVIRTLRDRKMKVPGVVGEKESVQLFCERWKAQTGMDYRLYMDQRVYALHEVNFPESVSGEARQAVDADLNLFKDWLVAFHEESLPGQTPQDPLAYAKRMLDEGSVYLWMDDGIPVSTASSIRPQENSTSIGMVYTPPALRRRGYASAVVASLSQEKLDEGCQYCTLFTDLSNPTSNAIYQKIGYKPVCDYRMYHFVFPQGE